MDLARNGSHCGGFIIAAATQDGDGEVEWADLPPPNGLERPPRERLRPQHNMRESKVRFRQRPCCPLKNVVSFPISVPEVFPLLASMHHVLGYYSPARTQSAASLRGTCSRQQLHFPPPLPRGPLLLLPPQPTPSPHLHSPLPPSGRRVACLSCQSAKNIRVSNCAAAYSKETVRLDAHLYFGVCAATC